VVVVVEFPVRGRGRVVLNSAGGAGAATVVVVAVDGEMGSPNAGCMAAGSERGCPRGRDSTSPGRRAEKA